MYIKYIYIYIYMYIAHIAMPVAYCLNCEGAYKGHRKESKLIYFHHLNIQNLVLEGLQHHSKVLHGDQHQASTCCK